MAERLPPDGAGEADPAPLRRRGGLAGGKDQAAGVSKEKSAVPHRQCH